MSEAPPPRCRSCRHWQRLTALALIGRCREPASGQAFTHESQHCRRWLEGGASDALGAQKKGDVIADKPSR